jgi:hypothetical protein
MWEWRVTARFPGSRFPGTTSGREISRKDAGRCVVECYERMLTHYTRASDRNADSKDSLGDKGVIPF